MIKRASSPSLLMNTTSSRFVLAITHRKVWSIGPPRSGQQGQQREVYLLLKSGVEAKNYEDIAKAEKLKPLEVYMHYDQPR